MTIKKPILSICIPTYNRANYLRKCLESIVTQDIFDSGEIEIIISDNNSSDNTEYVSREFCDKYNNIYYFKNNENVRDINFPLALSRANGIYRKLCNDTMCFQDNSMSELLNVIKSNDKQRPVIFFPHIRIPKKTNTDSLDDFLKEVSFYITSISCFGVWEDDFYYTEEGCDKSLWQVPFIINNVIKKEHVIIIHEKFYTIQPTQKKDLSYGLYQVFFCNYLGFINEQVQTGQISKECYAFLERDVVLNFLCEWMAQFRVNSGNKYVFSEREALDKLILKNCKSKPYYFKLKIKYQKKLVKLKIKKTINIIREKNE